MIDKNEYILFRNFDFKEYDCLKPYKNIILVDVPYTKESGLKNILWHQWLFQKLLKKHKYPPEGMEDAVQTVMTQCELWTDNNVA